MLIYEQETNEHRIQQWTSTRGEWRTQTNMYTSLYNKQKDDMLYTIQRHYPSWWWDAIRDVISTSSLARLCLLDSDNVMKMIPKLTTHPGLSGAVVVWAGQPGFQIPITPVFKNAHRWVYSSPTPTIFHLKHSIPFVFTFEDIRRTNMRKVNKGVVTLVV